MSSIILFDGRSSVGGGQTVFLQLVALSIKEFQKVSVAIPFGGKFQDKILKRFGNYVDLVSIPEIKLGDGTKGLDDVIKWIWYSFAFIRYWKLIKRHDIWYVNSSRLLLPIVLARLFFKRRVFFHVHLNHHNLDKTVILIMLRLGLISKVICCSEFVHSRLVAFNGYFNSGNRCIPVTNALTYGMEEIVFENRFGYFVPNWNVAVIGWIGRYKGQDIALTLLKRFPNIRLYLIGAVAPSEQEFFRALNIEADGKVEFVGPVEDVASAIHDLNIHFSLIPSRIEESFGLVAIESMANSCITLSAALGGLVEISRNTGHILFNDEKELLERFAELVSLRANELEDIARSQFEKCKIFYANKRFDSEMIAAFGNST